MLNAQISKEIGKLPDLHDGVSSIEIKAIEKLIEMYNQNPNDFDQAFDRMNKIGKEETRKYCAPLQALFWLAQKDSVEDSTRLLEYYNMRNL